MTTDPQTDDLDRLADTDLDEIAARAGHLFEYVTMPSEADQLAGVDVPALIGEVRRLRALPAAALPSIHANDVEGFCPACGHGVLMLGEGGHVVCTLMDCPRPEAADELLRNAAAPVAAPPTGQAGLRDRIDEALRPHASLGGTPPRYELPFFDGATPSLPRISGWKPLDDVAAVLAELPADSEPHRLALSSALGLGTSAPWDAIRERAAELAVQAVAGDRAAVLRELIAEAEECDGHITVQELRRMARKAEPAAETPGPETQGAEPWLTDSARIGRTLIWSWSDVGKGAFREGYRAAQAEARALLGGERGTDQQQPAVVAEPGKEA